MCVGGWGLGSRGAGCSVRAMPVHPRVEAALNLIDVWLDAHCAFQGLPGVSAGVVSPTHPALPSHPAPAD